MHFLICVQNSKPSLSIAVCVGIRRPARSPSETLSCCWTKSWPRKSQTMPASGISREVAVRRDGNDISESNMRGSFHLAYAYFISQIVEYIFIDIYYNYCMERIDYFNLSNNSLFLWYKWHLNNIN